MSYADKFDRSIDIFRPKISYFEVSEIFALLKGVSDIPPASIMLDLKSLPVAKNSTSYINYYYIFISAYKVLLLLKNS